MSEIRPQLQPWWQYTAVIARLVFLMLSLAGLSVSVSAAEVQEAPVRPDALVSSESMMQMFLGLVVVVLIIFALSLLVKRFSLLPGSSSGMIKILGGLPLNNKDRLLLIQVGDEQILVSASPGRVGKVHELRNPLNPEEFHASNRTESKSFNTLLDQVLKKS